MELAHLLERISTIASNHKLIYQFESKHQDANSARIALLLVPPDNKLNYATSKLKNDLDALAKYVEAEVLITLKQDGDEWSAKWKWRIGEKIPASPINLIRPEIEQALIPTDWLQAHRQLEGENERKIAVIKLHNRRWKHEFIAEKTNYAKTSVDNIVTEMRAKYPYYVRGDPQSRKPKSKK